MAEFIKAELDNVKKTSGYRQKTPSHKTDYPFDKAFGAIVKVIRKITDTLREEGYPVGLIIMPDEDGDPEIWKNGNNLLGAGKKDYFAQIAITYGTDQDNKGGKPFVSLEVGSGASVRPAQSLMKVKERKDAPDGQIYELVEVNQPIWVTNNFLVNEKYLYARSNIELPNPDNLEGKAKDFAQDMANKFSYGRIHFKYDTQSGEIDLSGIRKLTQVIGDCVYRFASNGEKYGLETLGFNAKDPSAIDNAYKKANRNRQAPKP